MHPPAVTMGEAPPEPRVMRQNAPGSPGGAPSTPPPGFSGFVETHGIVSLEAEHFTQKVDHNGAGWEIIPGLGRTGDAVAIFPTTVASIDPARLAADAPRLEYQVFFSAAGDVTATLNLLPTQPIGGGNGLRLALALDDQAPETVTAGAEVGSRAWAQRVLNELVTASTTLHVPAPGMHRLQIYMVDAGVVLDKIVLARDGPPPGYLGPPETRVAQ